MNTSDDSKANVEILSSEVKQLLRVLEEFFSRDPGSEVIESLNELAEAVLFDESRIRITVEMRNHLVNQLRTATLIANLQQHFWDKIA
ncbi:hypothetical protein [Dyadobacter bucti]|uniref:hypothetical protein n=1 Tax=Dyadobacter bucti TaxID=2572203 RepID=UPI001107BAE9|nr:hypothetical protein [Dyadobacter bucti]